MSVINSKQDSDRLIRELMIKNKDLEARYSKAADAEKEHASSIQQAQQALTESQNENRELTKMLSKARLELDDQVTILLLHSLEYLPLIGSPEYCLASPTMAWCLSVCRCAAQAYPTRAGSIVVKN
jgi:hypothetical protein